MEIFIILGLILLNGIFAMSEIAVVSARRSRLESDSKKGSKAAKAALDLANNPDKFLSTVQIGITLIGILTGLYSGEVFAEGLGRLLEQVGLSPAYSVGVAKTLIVIIVTFLTIVLGELVPKRIGMTAAEKVSKIIARPMKVLSIIASPFVWLLSKTTSLIFNLFKLNNKDSKVTEEEIRSLLQESTDDGEITELEQDIVERVFALSDRNVNSIMTHHSDIDWLDTKATNAELYEKIGRTQHDIYPVGEGDIDEVVGVVYLKDLFGKFDNPEFRITDVVHSPHFLHETTNVYTALERMKEERTKYALISDEFGDVQGIVTLKDILEALVGSIPQLDEEQDIVKREDGSYLVDGQCSYYDFLAYFDLEDDFPSNEFNTLSGLIIKELSHIPRAGEVLTWHSFRMEIADMDGARIDKVIITPLEVPEENQL